jgi:serine/threonine protein kinase
LNKQTYGTGVDIWAAGILLHLLVIGDPPFIANSKQELFMMIKKLEFTLAHTAWSYMSEELKDIIKQIL